MAYLVPTFAKIRDDILRDIANFFPEADIGPDSDYFARASSVASAVEGLYQHQSWTVRQIFPDTADSEFLRMHARVRGLGPKPAVAAAGQIRLAGTVGAPFAVGLAGKVADGREYQITVAGQIGADGTAIADGAATVAGTLGNAADGTPLTLTSAPPGIASTATIVTMKGGVDEETDAQLLERLLDLIRRPPAGGNRYDYRRWALEVAGVTAAYVYPLRRGLGTVDTVITSAGGMPSQQTIDAAQAHIDDQRPVTAKGSLVIAPTEKLVPVTVAVDLSGTTLAAIKPKIDEALAAHFAALAPGETAVKSVLEGLVTNLQGVVDRSMSLPATNIVPVVDDTKVEWCRLGAVTVTEMT